MRLRLPTQAKRLRQRGEEIQVGENSRLGGCCTSDVAAAGIPSGQQVEYVARAVRRHLLQRLG